MGLALIIFAIKQLYDKYYTGNMLGSGKNNPGDSFRSITLSIKEKSNDDYPADVAALRQEMLESRDAFNQRMDQVDRRLNEVLAALKDRNGSFN